MSLVQTKIGQWSCGYYGVEWEWLIKLLRYTFICLYSNCLVWSWCWFISLFSSSVLKSFSAISSSNIFCSSLCLAKKYYYYVIFYYVIESHYTIRLRNINWPIRRLLFHLRNSISCVCLCSLSSWLRWSVWRIASCCLECPVACRCLYCFISLLWASSISFFSLSSFWSKCLSNKRSFQI